MQELERIADLAVDYIGYMFGCGVHTARVLRCAERICRSQGVKLDVMCTLQHFTVTVTDDEGNRVTRVSSIVPVPVSFEHNTNLSALSWRAVDQRLTIEQIREQFDNILHESRLHPLLLTLLVGIANACFCMLFGGDFVASVIVCIATMIGFALRLILTAKYVNQYVVFAMSAFVASICASSALLFNCTADIAIATSPLFLIPGVPLINGILDILDSNILVGFSRLVSAFILILCIAIGLSVTLLLVKDHLIY